MPLNIQPVGMWVTPKSQEELQAMVEGLNSPEAIHAMMFTWNYLAYLIKYEDENGVRCEGCDLDCQDCICPEDRSSQNPYAEINPDD